MADYQRAYSPERKAERYSDLMHTTDRLFRERGFHEVTISSVAKELGWTRSNVYRYARTIEEVFLALYKEKYDEFTADLMAAARSKAPDTPHDLGILFCDVVERHRDYLDYQSILGSIIETNIPHEMLVEFKRELEVKNTQATQLAMQCVPCLSYEQALEVFIGMIYLASGTNSHFRSAEKQSSAMKEAGVRFGAQGFRGTLEPLVEALLAGTAAAR